MFEKFKRKTKCTKSRLSVNHKLMKSLKFGGPTVFTELLLLSHRQQTDERRRVEILIWSIVFISSSFRFHFFFFYGCPVMFLYDLCDWSRFAVAVLIIMIRWNEIASSSLVKWSKILHVKHAVSNGTAHNDIERKEKWMKNMKINDGQTNADHKFKLYEQKNSNEKYRSKRIAKNGKKAMRQ